MFVKLAINWWRVTIYGVDQKVLKDPEPRNQGVKETLSERNSAIENLQRTFKKQQDIYLIISALSA